MASSDGNVLELLFDFVVFPMKNKKKIWRNVKKNNGKNILTRSVFCYCWLDVVHKRYVEIKSSLSSVNVWEDTVRRKGSTHGFCFNRVFHSPKINVHCEIYTISLSSIHMQSVSRFLLLIDFFLCLSSSLVFFSFWVFLLLICCPDCHYFRLSLLTFSTNWIPSLAHI